MSLLSLRALSKGVAQALRPPEALLLSEWAAKNFRLSSAVSAQPGRYRPWKFQKGILDAIGDPLIERVSVIKSARTGYTTSLVAAIGGASVNDPGPMILLMPTDDDARGIAKDEIDPAFRDTPILRGVMRSGRLDNRNTLTQRTMQGGGSLKILSSRAPRNLRRHTARYLFCDEVDGMMVTAEGDPLKLAEMRTLSYADRKLVFGSTPTDEATSLIINKYGESDQRVFELPCWHCEELFELMWEHIDWKTGRPDTAVAICPSCGCSIEEKHKPELVEAGDWRAQAPEVQGHAGFRMNSLISLFSNASWAKLVSEYEIADRAGNSEMQVFYNTVLGKVWSNAVGYVGENALMARAENFGLYWDSDLDRWRQDIPQEVAYITAGVDVQPDRLEVSLIGHSKDARFSLGHTIFYGDARQDLVWDELLDLLTHKWRHPLGGEIEVSATGVDSGDGNMTQVVYDFCERVQQHRIFAIKGAAGPRKVIEASKAVRRNRTAPLYIVGVDQVKTDIGIALSQENMDKGALRFSAALPEEYFIQLTSERRVLQYKLGRPQVTFEPIGNRRHEALDCMVYGLAVRGLLKLNYEERYEMLKAPKKTGSSLSEALESLHS